jgi:hypothetical protein
MNEWKPQSPPPTTACERIKYISECAAWLTLPRMPTPDDDWMATDAPVIPEGGDASEPAGAMTRLELRARGQQEQVCFICAARCAPPAHVDVSPYALVQTICVCRDCR